MMNKIAFYETPMEIVNFMINMTNLKNKKILDTGFGTGNFFNQILLKNNNLFGIELDENFYNKQCLKTPKLINNLINNDFLNYNFKNKFDIIIGNPPYITNDNLPIKIKNKIKDLTKSGEGNIYYAFILRSLELLNNNGELIYIVPIDFINNTYAKYLRKKMIKYGYFEYIIDLGETKIFNKANVEVIIFKFIKTKNIINKQTKIIKLKNRINYSLMIKDLIDIYNNNKIKNNFKYKIIKFFNNDNWFLDEKNNNIEYIKFNDLFNIYVGIVNGCEKAFIVDNDFINKLNLNEKKLISKFIKNKHSNNNYINDFQYYIFVDDYIKEEKELKQYPNVYNHLLKYKEKLENRYIPKNKKWFHYLAVRNKKVMIENKDNYKLLLPCITRKKEKWCSITKQDVLISSDLLLLIPKNKKDIYFLFFYLNSNFFKEYYYKYGILKGNRIYFKQGYLNNFEIPKIYIKSARKPLAL